MKQERDDQKRRRIEDENKTQRPATGGQKNNRGQGSKSGQQRSHGQTDQPGSSGQNRPMDIDDEEEETSNDQRKRA